MLVDSQANSQYKYYSLISMAYITSIIASITFFNKFIAIGPYLASISLFSYSFTYFFGNAISEVYGFILARRLILSAIICGNTFTLYCNIILKIHSPAYQNHDYVLTQVMGGSLRASIAGTIAMLAGGYTSAYIISKTKIFFLGRNYWIRNLFASSLGEFVNTIIVFPLGMFATISNEKLIELTLTAYAFKIFTVLLLIIPSALFVYCLKKAEKIDCFDKSISYSLFTF